MQDDTKRWDDSLISLGLGALVVVVSGILLYNYFTDQTPKILQNQTQTLASPTVIAQAQTTTEPAAGQITPIAFSSRPSNEVPAPVVSPSVGPTRTAQPTVAPTVAPTLAPTPIATAAPLQTPVPVVSSTPAATVAPTAAPAVAQATTENKTLPAQHAVVAGDTLWDLSEKYYGTGFEWRKIAQANKITPGSGVGLVVGATIEIPRNEMISATATEKSQVAQATPAASAQAQASVTPTPTAVAQATPAPQQPNTTVAQGQANGTLTYTVAHGDTLWSIAGEKCGNNYAWSSIAKQNKLVSPGVIHAGNVLTFSCQ